MKTLVEQNIIDPVSGWWCKIRPTLLPSTIHNVHTYWLPLPCNRPTCVFVQLPSPESCRHMTGIVLPSLHWPHCAAPGVIDKVSDVGKQFVSKIAAGLDPSKWTDEVGSSSGPTEYDGTVGVSNSDFHFSTCELSQESALHPVVSSFSYASHVCCRC